MRKVTYYAAIAGELENLPGEDDYSIMFPDIPCCYTCAESRDNVAARATNALSLCIEDMCDDDSNTFYEPSTLAQLRSMRFDPEWESCVTGIKFIPVTVTPSAAYWRKVQPHPRTKYAADDEGVGGRQEPGSAGRDDC